MFHLIYYITGFAFLLVAAGMVLFLIQYRDRGDGRRATYSHGNNTLEIIWTVIPAIVFIALGVLSSRTWAEVKINIPPPEFTVRLEAKQFNWAFTYPGPDGQFGTKDDYSQENILRVPANKVVHVQMQSKDVIHSFFVPQFRLKQDVLPGRTITTWFKALEAGKYELPCAELCGFGHTTMQGWVTVLDPADTGKWAETDRKTVLRGWPQAMQPAGLAPAATPTPEPAPAATPAAAEPAPSPSPSAASRH
jgi:cytochrome c oxidase subunit 2